MDKHFSEQVDSPSASITSLNSVDLLRAEPVQRRVDSTSQLSILLPQSSELLESLQSAEQVKPARGTADRFDPGELFSKLLPKLDKNGNGEVSAFEVHEAFKDPKYKGKDAGMICWLKIFFDDIKKLGGNKDGTIGIAQVQAFEELREQFRKEKHLINACEKFGPSVVDYLDSDSDGKVTKAELFSPVFNNGGNYSATEALQHMRQNFEKISKGSGSITVDDLAAFVSAWHQEDRPSYLCYDSLMTRSLESRPSGQLFGDIKDPLRAIVPAAIEQGTLGDCFFLSSVTAVVSEHPERIKDMIHDNKNGTFTVTFPGDPGRPVTIETPTEKELLAYAQTGKYGIWPAVLEKAYGQYRKEHPDGGLSPQKWPDLVHDYIANGGRNGLGLEALTGVPVDAYVIYGRFTVTNEGKFIRRGTLQAEMIAASNDGRVMTAATDEPQLSGVVGSHNYTILSCNGNSVTLRNPWGSGEPADKWGHRPRDGKDDGVFTLTWDEFQKNFTTVAITTK